jgi:hypothetical protein
MQQFLGFIIDTKKMEIRLPKEKINRIKKDMRVALRPNLLSIRKLAAIAGLLQSTAMAVFPARHHTWPFLQQVHRGLHNANNQRHSWEWQVAVSTEWRETASWWLTELNGWNGRTMVRETPDVTLETDASDFGWGFAVQHHATANQFGQDKRSLFEKLMSISWR